ncbi:MAG: hypothetical protein GXY80_02230 [Syntrophorhabdus aromaticivorans]|uniref:Uncharacterized protein n=1 Tax=Syntrophorhabdus aromaticivorans TaxID=328301 RepID=A0A971M1B7_9BACT|nr:hypothetical protein [Syntrophorhabdus aromaticivorans]
MEVDRLWAPVYPCLARHISEVHGRKSGRSETGETGGKSGKGKTGGTRGKDRGKSRGKRGFLHG